MEKIASSPLPIFKGLEAFIESNDKDNDARIAKEFKAHGGGVVTSKGEKSTSHAILNHRDDEINDPITVQVRPEWIDDSIKAGRLQDEQNYKPPSKYIHKSIVGVRSGSRYTSRFRPRT